MQKSAAGGPSNQLLIEVCDAYLRRVTVTEPLFTEAQRVVALHLSLQQSDLSDTDFVLDLHSIEQTQKISLA